MDPYSLRDRLLRLLYIVRGWLTPKNIAFLAAGLVLLIGATVAYAIIRQPSPEQSRAFESGVIRVGICTGSTFAYEDENGEIAGFERAFADELVDRLYGGGLRVEYKALNSQNASYAIKEGQVDIAIGMLVQGITKTKGTLMTTFYYADDNIVVMNDGGSMDQLNGANIGVMSTEISKSTVSNSLKGQISDFTVKGCTSYTDAMTSLANGTIKALICSKKKLEPYLTDAHRIVGTAGQSGYCVMTWTTEGDLNASITNAIKAFRMDGTFDRLYAEWGI